MSDFNLPSAPNQRNDTDSGSGMADAAKTEAVELKDTAMEQSENVVETVKSETHVVAQDAKREIHDLYDEARRELTEQAGVQQERVAGGLRSISHELSSMADNAERPGVATELVSRASDRAEHMAFWLDHRSPGGILDEVKSFARRKPGTFIAAAAIAGLLAGRLTRALASDDSSGSQGSGSSARVAGGTGSTGGSHAAPSTSVGAGAATPASARETEDALRSVRGTEGLLPGAQPETPLDPNRLREDLR